MITGGKEFGILRHVLDSRFLDARFFLWIKDSWMSVREKSYLINIIFSFPSPYDYKTKENEN